MKSSEPDLAATGRSPRRMELEGLQGVDLHAEYHSVRTGGDFFDAVDLGTHVIFLLTDIAGTKEATQPIASEVQRIFRGSAAELLGPAGTNVMDATAQLAQAVNHELIRAAKGVRFAPTFLGCYDLALGILAYVNAGGLTAVFHDSEGARILTSASVPLGLFTHLTHEPAMQAFEPGAKLLLVTKGVMETRHGRTHFGVERLIPLMQDAAPGFATQSATELCLAALKAAEEFKQVPWYSRLNPFGHRQEDEDLTALALVRHGTAG
ncbi:PP2C family protein-serine/threonine phosphatase [Tunturibacter empetritectus]|uniref:Serine phosphatase RsbU (Regulator of sigma subunit) n=1 Tax=Tunturiibacter empetritectus TaxID=3069691 RepID=A0A7W8MPG2_9BACT|nr:SpoIIE family protein phosphatase [Edaphobacter lichenicola]MBB5315656.1 serine phosphatase RsbU (regulator of sigma subunit) [Edaphobacter lichenicola]